MGINLDKPQLWKADTAKSVDLYNEWFMNFAPTAFREERILATAEVVDALRKTANLTDISPDLLLREPKVLRMLRMATCPPIARDRLIGLAQVPRNLVLTMEKGRLPPRSRSAVLGDLRKISSVIRTMADPDIFGWIGSTTAPSEAEVGRAASIVADRLCGANTDPIVRNAQETRQLALIERWLLQRGYKKLAGVRHEAMPPGTFSFRLNILGKQEDSSTVNIPVDVAIMPLSAIPNELPFMIEAKSAGDFTNVNKRRKEEATKIAQLRRSCGGDVRFVLFLCGYFDSGYLGYEAGEGIDWVWEHRIDDLAMFGL